MTMRLTLIMLLILIAFVCTGGCDQGEPTANTSPSPTSSPDSPDELPLTLTIGLDKEVYTVNSLNIEVNGRLRNISQDEIIVNARFAFPGPEIHLTIESDAGEVLRWLPPVPPPALTAEDFTTLDPGQELTFSLVFYNSDLYDKLTPGGYDVQARYVNSAGDEFGLDAWTGVIHSNTVGFRVVE